MKWKKFELLSRKFTSSLSELLSLHKIYDDLTPTMQMSTTTCHSRWCCLRDNGKELTTNEANRYGAVVFLLVAVHYRPGKLTTPPRHCSIRRGYAGQVTWICVVVLRWRRRGARKDEGHCCHFASLSLSAADGRACSKFHRWINLNGLRTVPLSP